MPRPTTTHQAPPHRTPAGWQLVTLGTLMRRAIDRALLPLGTSTEQVQTFDALAANERMTVGAIGLALGLERNSASQLVERLWQKGLVQRHRTPADRRCVFVELTEAGRALLTAAKPHVLAVTAALKATLSPEEVAVASRLIAQASELLQLRHTYAEDTVAVRASDAV